MPARRPLDAPHFLKPSRKVGSWNGVIARLSASHPGRVARPTYPEPDAWSMMVAPYNFGDIQNGLGGEGVLGMVSVHVMGVSSGGDYSPQAYLGTDAAGFRDRYRALRDLVRYRNAVERVLAKLDFHPTLPEESSPDHFSHANHVNRQDAVACVSNLVEQILTIPPVAKGTYR